MFRKIPTTIFLVFVCGAAITQNVGIGTTTPTRAGLVVNNKVGSVHAIFGDNASGVSIESNWPGISFNGYYNGGRRTLVTGFTSGVEMNPTTGNFNIYTSPASTVGGNIASVFNRITVKAGGNVGIGVDDPGAILHINGGVKINGNNSLEFGAGIAGKETNAGKIGYALFTTDAVDMVGASVGGAARKIRFWAEGGSRFEGPIHTSNIFSYTGLTSDNINLNANATVSGFTKLGTTSLPLKTLTLLVDIQKFNSSFGTSWAIATSPNIPIEVNKIVSHTVVSVAENSSGLKVSYPIVGDANEFGKGKYSISATSGSSLSSYFLARYDDCDLCDKNAKAILHIVYTDQNLLQ